MIATSALTGADDVISLRRIGDHSHCARQDICVVDSFSKGCLVSRTHRNLGRRNVSPGRTIDQIHTRIFQVPGEVYRFIEGPSTFNPIGRRNPHQQRRALRPRSANSSHDFQQKADAVLERPTVFISAMIREWRKDSESRYPCAA